MTTKAEAAERMAEALRDAASDLDAASLLAWDDGKPSQGQHFEQRATKARTALAAYRAAKE